MSAAPNPELSREVDARPAPSPNFGLRKDGRTPTLVILHYTGMQSAEAALARLRDPEAEVSAHYLIDESGGLFALVDEAARAWHAGRAEWRGEPDVNSASVGIELVNRGHPGEGGGPYHPFPEPQTARLESLLAGLFARWALTPAAILAHSDVAPERKSDPGEKFDWARLARRGLAIGPPATGLRLGAVQESAAARRAEESADALEARFLTATARIGYGSWEPAAVREAFRRRFAPARLGAPLSAADALAAENVAETWRGFV